MKSIRTDPPVHASEGDERNRHLQETITYLDARIADTISLLHQARASVAVEFYGGSRSNTAKLIDAAIQAAHPANPDGDE